MSTLIRDPEREIPPLRWTQPGPGPAPARDPFVEALEEEIAGLRAQMSTQRADADAAIVQAYERGIRQAEETFARDEEARITLLREALDKTEAAARENLAALEQLAPLLCETALENIFEASEAMRDLVTASIARQLAAVRSDFVLAVRVSPADFPEPAALEEIAAASGDMRRSVLTDPALASGECVIEMRLGQIELSTPRYWGELKAQLRACAVGHAP